MHFRNVCLALRIYINNFKDRLDKNILEMSVANNKYRISGRRLIWVNDIIKYISEGVNPNCHMKQLEKFPSTFVMKQHSYDWRYWKKIMTSQSKVFVVSKHITLLRIRWRCIWFHFQWKVYDKIIKHQLMQKRNSSVQNGTVLSLLGLLFTSCKYSPICSSLQY